MLDIDNEIATIKEVFRENLNRYFKNKGCTQKELAAFIGVSPATINEWLKGRKSPRMDKVDKLCTFFMCNRSDLMEKFDSDSAPAPKEESPLSAHEKAMVDAYHKAPDNIQNVVNVALNSYSDEDLPALAEKEKGTDLNDSTAV